MRAPLDDQTDGTDPLNPTKPQTPTNPALPGVAPVGDGTTLTAPASSYLPYGDVNTSLTGGAPSATTPDLLGGSIPWSGGPPPVPPPPTSAPDLTSPVAASPGASVTSTAANTSLPSVSPVSAAPAYNSIPATPPSYTGANIPASGGPPPPPPPPTAAPTSSAAPPVDWNTARPGSWTGQGLTGNETADPSSWNPTLSNDPAMIAQVNAQLAGGTDPTTGRQTSLSQAVTSKGYRWDNGGNIVDPSTGQVVGNAFDLGPQGVAALPASSRGTITPAADDATAYKPPPPVPDTGSSTPVPIGETGGGGAIGNPVTSNTSPAAQAPLPTAPTPISAPPVGITPQLPQGVSLANTPPAVSKAATGGTFSGAATDTGTGSTPVNTSTTPVTQSTAALPGVTPTDPNNSLLNQTIGAPTQNDPYQIAQQQWDAFQKATNPTYEASLRDAVRQAAGAGAIGSGQLNTSLGDLANNRATQLDSQRQSLLANALTTANENAYRNVGIAQQQQGFQQGQQQTAFNQGITQTQLEDALKNSALGRALEQFTAGNSNDPTSLLLALSGIFGNAGSQAGNALGGLISGRTGNQTSQGSNDALAQYFRQLYGGGTTTPSAPNANPIFGTLTSPTPSIYSPNLGISY